MGRPIEDPIVEMVRERLKSRSEVGIRKYGKTLARKDLSLKQWLYHALEESLDHCLYLQRAIVEIEEKESRGGEGIAGTRTHTNSQG